MKRLLSAFLSLLFLLILGTTSSVSAQDLTGIWRGYFISSDGEQYKLEFQVNQNKDNVVSGVSYSYLDVRFYGKATMTGSFIPATSTFRIREIRTVEVKSMDGGTCIMNYSFAYSKSGKEEFLEGTFLGMNEQHDKSLSPGVWGDCGGGKVFLRRVSNTDFYVEPFLRDKIKKDSAQVFVNEPPTRKSPVKAPVKTVPVIHHPVTTGKPLTTNKTPAPKKPLVTKNTPPAKVIAKNKAPDKKPVIAHPTNTPVTKIMAPLKPVIDSSDNIRIPVVKNNLKQVITPIPDVLKNRQNALVKTLVLNNTNVVIKIYDNGEIDGDSVSVYVDKKLVLSHQMLTAKALIVTLTMQEDNEEHEIVMVADNEGRIPPNTSLMIVEAGDQRFDVQISSSEQKNAVVRLRYQKPK